MNAITQRGLPVAATSLAGVAVAAAVGLGRPGVDGWFPPCPFHALTGLWCPGCGSTRAAHELLHANLAGAFTFNPLLVLALPVAAYVYAAWALRATAGHELPRIEPTRRWSLAVLALLLAFAVARNLPFGAVAWMAP